MKDYIPDVHLNIDHINQEREQNLNTNDAVQFPVIPIHAESPTTFPTSWTRVVSSVPIVDNDSFIVRIQGIDKGILLRLDGVRLAEPWLEEVKKIIDVVWGESREGQTELWIKSEGWNGDIQLVESKDQYTNVIAARLTEIKVIEKTNARY